MVRHPGVSRRRTPRVHRCLGPRILKLHPEGASRVRRGLGIVIQGVDGGRPVTARTPSQLRQLLQTRSMPKNVRDALDKSLDGLTDADFRGLKPEEVLDLILQEYQGA